MSMDSVALKSVFHVGVSNLEEILFLVWEVGLRGWTEA